MSNLPTWSVLVGDVREQLATLPEASVQCCVTSPPYWGLRDYAVEGQIGINSTPAEYVSALVQSFRQVRRLLRLDGTVWLNLGDSFQNAKGQAGGIDPKQRNRRHGLRPQGRSIPGLKPKDLVGIPWEVALALRNDGWWLRQDIIWNKPNAHPEPVSDRPSTSHEHVFLLAKSRRYFFDAKAIGDRPSEAMLRQVEEGYSGTATRDYVAAGAPDPSATKLRVIQSARRRMERDGFLWVNARSVWSIHTAGASGSENHPALMPEELAERCIKAGSRVGDLVLDPFAGSGTTGAVAVRLGRSFVGVELNGEYARLAERRISAVAPLFATRRVLWPTREHLAFPAELESCLDDSGHVPPSEAVLDVHVSPVTQAEHHSDQGERQLEFQTEEQTTDAPDRPLSPGVEGQLQ